MIYIILFAIIVVLLTLFVYLPIIIDIIKYHKYKKNQVKIIDYHNNDDNDGLPKGVL